MSFSSYLPNHLDTLISVGPSYGHRAIANRLAHYGHRRAVRLPTIQPPSGTVRRALDNRPDHRSAAPSEERNRRAA